MNVKHIQKIFVSSNIIGWKMLYRLMWNLFPMYEFAIGIIPHEKNGGKSTMKKERRKSLNSSERPLMVTGADVRLISNHKSSTSSHQGQLI
jgi:hypothetical protein